MVPDCNIKGTWGDGNCGNYNNDFGYSSWADVTNDVYGSKSRCFEANFSSN